MSEHVLQVCYSRKEAIQSIKYRLNEIDENCIEWFDWYKEKMPERIKGKTVEERNWNDSLYLVYCADYFDDKVWIFEDEYDIERWLDEMWTYWDLWEVNDVGAHLNETLAIWEFHRDIRKEKWASLYEDSKTFIKGWSRRRRCVEFEFIPSFSVG